MLTPEERKEAEQGRKVWQEKIAENDEKKKKLYEANKEKVDERSKKNTVSSALATIAAISLIVGVIGLLFFDGVAFIATPIAGAVLFVLFIILRAKPAKVAKALSVVLADYDAKVAEIDGEIDKINGYIAEIDYELKRDSCERRWAAYNEGHICVYVGKSTSPGIVSDGKPQETADFYEDVVDVAVYIDGIEYGGTKKPFGAFEVTPGNHVIKIEAHYKFGGIDKYLESKAQQIKVTDKSAFVFYHWNFYKHGSGTAEALYMRVFDNPYDFLVHTHQENR